MYTTHASVCWGDVCNTRFVTGYFNSKPLSVLRYCPFIFIRTISNPESLTRLHLSMYVNSIKITLVVSHNH